MMAHAYPCTQPEDLSKVVHVKIPKQYWQLGAQTDGKKQPKGMCMRTSRELAAHATCVICIYCFKCAH